MIEAVFEHVDVKHQVFAEIEPYVDESAVLASNTSSLPITQLAEGVSRRSDFVGLHFFSPVDKMPLLEIVKGEQTSARTVAKAVDIADQLGKTPIVVNDSRGFFTSRVIGKFIDEAVAMVGEGIAPASIEQAGAQAGYPAAPLALSDELNLSLMQKIRIARESAAQVEGVDVPLDPAGVVVDALVDAGRPGRLAGAGFYHYENESSRTLGWTRGTVSAHR